MAVPAEDALLKAPGAARTILEHFDIVIGLNQEHVGSAHPLNHQARGVAEVGQNADIACRRLHQESNRVMGIVRNGKSLHKEVTELEAVACGE
jgi:hypothetical protein